MTFGEGQRESLDGAWGEGGDTQVKGALLSENNLEKQVWQTKKQCAFLHYNNMECSLSISSRLWHFTFIFPVLPVSWQPSAGAGAARLPLSLSMLCSRPCRALLRSAVEAAVSMLLVTASVSCSSS